MSDVNGIGRIADRLRDDFVRFQTDPMEQFRVAVRRKRAEAIRALHRDGSFKEPAVFNREVWPAESDTRVNGESRRGLLMTGTLTPELARELAPKLDSGELELHGNYCFGSATHVFAPMLKSDHDRRESLRRASDVLASSEPPAQKYRRLLELRGFGPNIASGLVMLFRPTEFAVYNATAKRQMEFLGEPTPDCLVYQERVQELRARLGADDFLELDWFLYQYVRAAEARAGAVSERPAPVGETSAAPSVWKIAPEVGAQLWDKWKREGHASIGWNELGDLRGMTKADFEERAKALDDRLKGFKVAGTRQVWKFANIPVGARIVANRGTTSVLGIGTVTGPYHYVPGQQHSHRLPVRWDDVEERLVQRPGWRKTLIQLEQADFDEIIAANGKGSGTKPPPPELDSSSPPPLDFDAIVAKLKDQLYFSEELIAIYLLALQAKRFVLLSGISGTGKTQLALQVARLFGDTGHAGSSDSSSGGHASAPARYVQVAVRPDWTDNRGLLGFHNPLTGRYQGTPFLDLLLRAEAEHRAATRTGRAPEPYFAILDEMNLARVEHYFSDFLSCLESGEPVVLHDSLELEGGAAQGVGAIPRELVIPPNLFITGTVNVDETTYMFSPKVLDRAFTLELNAVDLDGYQNENVNEDDLTPSSLALDSFPGHLRWSPAPAGEEYRVFRGLLDGAIFECLTDLNGVLAREHRHFGYRVANEIARFVVLASAQAGSGEETLWDAFDVAVLAKVLPKLHGTQQELETILTELFRFALRPESPKEPDTDPSAWSVVGDQIAAAEGSPLAPRLPRTAAKLRRMLMRLEKQGFASFIE